MSRKEFPNDVRRDALARCKKNGGFCECGLLALACIPGFDDAEGCGQLIGPGNTFVEHIIVDRAGGLNVLANAAVLVKTCWQIKTATYDLPKAAEVRRQEDKIFGVRLSRRPMPGSKRSGWKKPMGALVAVRR